MQQHADSDDSSSNATQGRKRRRVGRRLEIAVVVAGIIGTGLYMASQSVRGDEREARSSLARATDVDRFGRTPLMYSSGWAGPDE
ncbi:MAG: hypothetical protein AAF747_05130, partial [Planctomycetota bacterium]